MTQTQATPMVTIPTVIRKPGSFVDGSDALGKQSDVMRCTP